MRFAMVMINGMSIEARKTVANRKEIAGGV
jgi:hypothetical protein